MQMDEGPPAPQPRQGWIRRHPVLIILGGNIGIILIIALISTAAHSMSGC